MTAQPHAFEIPELVPLSKELVLGIVEAPRPAIVADPQPITVCVFDRLGKPLEVQLLDVSHTVDQVKLQAASHELASDDLSLMVWARDRRPPHHTAIDLLRRMVVQHAIGRLPESSFLQAWMREAEAAIADYNDIQEFIDHEHARPKPSPVEDDDDVD